MLATHETEESATEACQRISAIMFGELRERVREAYDAARRVDDEYYKAIRAAAQPLKTRSWDCRECGRDLRLGCNCTT